MRAFQFRAWHKETRKMFDVYGIEWSVDSLVFQAKRKVLLGGEHPYRWHTMHLIGKDGVTKVVRGHEVIDRECELMQFTGLKDKHGSEIYEDDIVKASYDWLAQGRTVTIGIAVFDEGRWIIKDTRDSESCPTLYPGILFRDIRKTAWD